MKTYFSVCFAVNFRHNLPIVILVVNNNGVYLGTDKDSWKEILKMGDASFV